MSIYQHYRADEKPFIDQIFESIHFVKDTYSFKLTDFLDPRQQEIVTQLASYDGQVVVFLDGGIENAERQRAIISPPYFEPESDDFGLAFFEVDYADKFFTIEHRQLLGALMNLGIIRDKFGDILINDKTVQFIVAKEVSGFVQLNLQAVGKATVALRKLNSEELIKINEEWKIQSGTVSSLRLDAVVSEMFHISRAKSAAYIQKGMVKVNWKVVEQPNYECCKLDTISVRGFGRGKLVSIDGQTKKEKWRIQYGKK
ncbi:RNA-binding protein [Pueribacillus theae]|uniref:RNA-binding protein n=1 Tax=Pueribacillus theae TaxID=2171751 RepID=A0A2U1K7C3_9BACI|nr:RNA-binding protein [Pueribacillus theae]PWA13426.1 RNA-binding protein [Pueribacillus theae]